MISCHSSTYYKQTHHSFTKTSLLIKYFCFFSKVAIQLLVIIDMIKRIIYLSKNNFYQKFIRYNYLTPVQKPVTSLAVSSMMEFSSEIMQFGYLELMMVPEVSVMLGALTFRLGLEALGLFFQSLNLKEKENWMYRWSDKIFLLDLKRDVAFYDLPAEKYNEMARYYRPEYLFTSLLKNYCMLNLFRGGHYIITTPQFQIFSEGSLGSLAAYDMLFYFPILPIAIIGLNYLILSKSDHPFMIHLVRKENKLQCLNFAFMGGLIFVPFPTIYAYSYIGLALGHLLIRFVKKISYDWREMFKKRISRK